MLGNDMAQLVTSKAFDSIEVKISLRFAIVEKMESA